MKQEEEILQSAGEVVEFARQYTNDQLKLLKLELAENTSKLIASLATSLAIIFIGMIVVFFLTVSLALIIGTWLDSNAAGFALVAAVYLIMGILLNIFKKSLLTEPILTVVIRQLFD
ncbi:MAG: hypothetical protein DHS20C18_12260 [Saprospiraceae bacterium]|nr:MAG: hypothetical protein DHS20C18_12260 [Saprospiraceae bacterium]